MTVRCPRALRALRTTTVAAIVMGLFASAVSPAQAAPRAWTGPYSMVTYASQKGGTSATIRQPESDFSAVFTVATNCASGACVATAIGPRIVEPDRPESVDLQLGRSAVEGRVRLGVAVSASPAASRSGVRRDRSRSTHRSPTGRYRACGTPTLPPARAGATW